MGFAIGSLFVGAGVYLLGTKKGRQTLTKILEVTENLEENLTSIVAELEQEVKEKTNEFKKDKPDLHHLLEKMKILRK